MIPGRSHHKQFVVSGRLVFSRDLVEPKTSGEAVAPQDGPAASSQKTPGGNGKLLGFPILHDLNDVERYCGLLQAPEVLTLEELARRQVEGLYYAAVLNQLADLGPDGRLLLYCRDGKLLRYELFENPRVCQDIERGAVVHNLDQKPADMSGWRVHEFYIDPKG